MKIYKRFSIRNLVHSIFVLIILISSDLAFAQTITPTNGTANCGNCTPSGWSIVSGQPDVSNRTTAATTSVQGGGANWVASPGSSSTITLPSPINGHSNWASLQDTGSAVQEAISTTITGLVTNRTYEVTLYSLTAVTNIGQANRKYAGKYNDSYNFQFPTATTQAVSSLSQNSWSSSTLRFTASSANQLFTLRGGANSTANGDPNPVGYEQYETVQLSVSAGAVNSVPVASNDVAATTGTTPVTINVTATDIDDGGSINVATVDLNTTTAGIQQTATNSSGTWSVDNLGNVTFTANNTFSGAATINYTVNDNFVLDGVSRAASSNIATITVNVAANPAIEVTKTASVVTGVGNTVTYTIRVENTGNVPLTGVNLTDTLTDLNGNVLTLTSGPTFISSTGPNVAGTLIPGEIATYRATKLITQAIVDAGGLRNTVTAQGASPANGTVSDVSDNGNDSDGNTSNDPTLTVIPENAIVDVDKIYSIVDNGDGVLGADDVITYTIRVRNTGNVTLTGLNLVDNIENFSGTSRTLATGPTFISSTQSSPPGTLKVGERANYQATYVIRSGDVESGGVRNSATARATTPAGNTISDVSDDNDDTDGNTVDDSTETPIVLSPSIEVTKTSSLIDNGDGVTGLDDVITYTITIRNTGNVNLINVGMTDTLTDLLGNPLTLTTGPTYFGSNRGSAVGSLLVGETASYTATYSVTQSNVNAGGVSNTVLGRSSTAGGTNITDVSDDGIDSDGNTTNDPTVTIIVQNPAIEATKTFTISDNGDGILGVDDIISYTIQVRNSGNVLLVGVGLIDTLTDANGNAISLTTGPTFLSANRGSSAGTLRTGETATYTATVALTQAVVDAGGVINSVLVNGSSPQNVNVTDVSDDGDDADGNTLNDSTETLIPETTAMEVTKVASLADNGDGVIGIDDVVSYTITIQNNGNVTIRNLNIVDTLTDLDGLPLNLTTGPTFVDADLGSPAGRIKSREIATYTATYVLTQSDVNSGGVRNSVTVNGISPNSTPVSDVSDDGIDSDGNTVDDPTETLIDQNPGIEATKIASLSDNGNGVLGVGDTVNYTILIKNTGNVDLINVNFTDTLEDFNNNSRSLTSGPTFVSAEFGSTMGNLLVGETATYTATYSIIQADVNAGGISNTVTAQGESPVGIIVTDVSDDGDDTDGNTQDDPTETITPEFPILKTTKIARIVDDGDGILGPGDILNYSITVKNTGNVNLNNVDITDNLTDLLGNSLSLTTGPTFIAADKGSSEGVLLVEEIATYTAVYVLTQSDVDAGGVSNSAISEGRSPFGITISDTSDDGDDSDGNTEDDPTETLIPEDPSIEATKTADITDNGDGSLGEGDTITYTFSVLNTGTVSLTGITLVDTLQDLLGNDLTLASGPTYQSSDFGSLEGTLLPEETAIYIATYVLTDSDVTAGGVRNSVVVSGDSPRDTNVTDTSDDGDDTDGNTTDDPTETLIPKMEITKTFAVTDNGDGLLGTDDTITYTITVENTGDIAITALSLVDTLTDLLGNPRTLSTPVTFQSATGGSTQTNLLPGTTATFVATYIIVDADIVGGGLSNTVTGSGSSPDGDPVSDVSDDGDDDDGNTEDDATETPIIEIVMLEATKIAVVTDEGDGIIGAGDTITYTITIENTGNVPLLNVSADDTLTDLAGNSLSLTSGPTFVETNLLGIEGILVPGEIATYSATYIITSNDVDAGGVSNSIEASASSVLGTDVTDTSDDGDDTDGNTEDDPTVTLIPEVVSIEATKIAGITDNGNDILGVDDIITYTITVQNTGNVTLNNITLEDILTDFNGTSLNLTSGPDFVSADASSPEGSLQAGESATYTATYIITQSDVDAAGIRNIANVSGDSPTDTNVTDTSDDGDDEDGNTEDDPTETPISQTPSINANKTAVVTDEGDGIVGLGDTITYTFEIENTGNVTLDNVTITDNLTDFLGNGLSLTTQPTFVSSSMGSAEGTLVSGEIATYTATYDITQNDVDAGGVRNSADISADSPDDTEVTDTTDDGDDTDGNTDDDPTETPIAENPSIEVTKTFTVDDNGDTFLGAADTITYTITVENTGTVTVNNINLVDTLTDFLGSSINLTSGPIFVTASAGSSEGTLKVGETATYTATYIIVQSDVDAGGVRNIVIANGDTAGGTDVTDTSDDGDDTDGNTEDDPTETPISETLGLEATKTYTITNNGSDVLGAGDVVNYTITVQNTGNTTLIGVSIVDSLSDFSRNILALTAGPTFDSSDMGSAEGILVPGEIATYTATYTITQSDVEAGGLSNTVLAEGDGSGGNTTDRSDDGDDDDGNTEDDPTETPIPIVTQLETTKIADVADNGDGLVGVGDVVTYTITVENTGNIDVELITITDTFTDLLGTTLEFSDGPSYVSSSMGSAEGSLVVGEIATYTATYTITQNDVDAGGLTNSVVTSGTDTDGTDVTDTSDDGDDNDGNTDDDPTETLTDSDYDLSVTKDVDNREPMIGENVVFTITLSNDGLVTAVNITLSDLLPTGYNFVSSTTTAGSYSESSGDWTVDLLNPGQIEMLEITAEVLGFGDYLNIASITDSDGGPDDDPSNDTDSADVEPICLIVYNEFSPNGDGVNETFIIDCIENYPTSKLEVYNRWGNIVYETTGYKNDWSGTSNGRAVIGKGEDLPVGTYYYVIDLKNGSEPKSGWLYINR
ncbi:conserved repeat domain-containing protein/gliding motility-associated C-terminal domain-containing protein [Flavobacteriaceae bacterium MAR_2010_188]|nr:conserved repeat domain-containing protein/gliding motility-associated C-terminal domain-containing protein [Flavobacteriaceae bacterium MAR_2010_188]